MDRTPSRITPRYGRRGCLCKDGKTYSRKCCDGTVQAEGIGPLTKGHESTITNTSVQRTKSNSHG